jgi:hypothetical protein
MPQTEAAFQPAVSCGATASVISVASRRMIVSRPSCPTPSGYGVQRFWLDIARFCLLLRKGLGG